MVDQTNHSESDLIAELLLDWEEAYERGNILSAEQLAGERTALVPELQRRINALRRFGQLQETTAVTTDHFALVSSVDVPGYEILSVLGKGGMGVVYKARQTSLGRLVAIKTLSGGSWGSRAELDRLRSEAKSLGALRHPNVVQIHDVLEVGGRVCLVLELVEGSDLGRQTSNAPYAPRDAAETVRTICRAMDAVHKAGLLHRDLKPANILRSHVDGELKITDFGLAKQQWSDTGQTIEGQVLGSPAYMAPEQAAGEISKVDARTDVYGLGATLYELLTGRPPFVSSSVAETLRMVCRDEPVALRALVPSIPKDLQNICLKAIEKEKGRRYQSAADLADDLWRFLENKPVLARPISSPARLYRWWRRNPTTGNLLAALAVLLIGGAIGTNWYLTSLAASNARTEQAVQKSILSRSLMRSARRPPNWIRENSAEMQNARAALLDDADRMLAREIIADGLISNDLEFIDSREFKDEAYCLEFLADGKTLAAGGNRAVTGPLLLPVVNVNLFPLEGSEAPKALQYPIRNPWALAANGTNGVRSLAISPDGTLCAAGTRHGQICVWRVVDREIVADWSAHQGWVTGLVFDPDGEHLLSAAQDRMVKRWNLGSPGKAQAEMELDSPIEAMALIAAGVVTVGEEPRLLDPTKLTILELPEIWSTRSFIAVAHPDKQGVITASDDIALLSPKFGAVRRFYDAQGKDIRSRSIDAAAIDPQGRWFATVDDQTLQLWDLPSGLPISQLELPEAGRDLAFHPSRPELVVSYGETIARYAVVASGAASLKLSRSQVIRSMAASNRGTPRLAAVTIDPSVGGDRGALFVHDVAADKSACLEEADNNRLGDVALSSAGDFVALVAENSRKLRLYQSSGPLSETFAGDAIHHPKFSSESNTLCFVERSDTSALQGKPPRQLSVTTDGHEKAALWINSIEKATENKSDILAVEMIGRMVLLSTHGQSLVSIDAETKKVESIKLPQLVRALAVTDDCAWGIAGDEEGTLTTYQLPDLVRYKSWPELADSSIVCMSLSGDLLALGSKDRTLRLLRVNGGELEPLLTMNLLRTPKQVHFSGSGGQIALLLDEDTAIRWIDVAEIRRTLATHGLDW